MKYLLLLLPCILALATPLYNTIEPSLFGIPFFFWSQLAMILISVVFIYMAYVGEQS